MQPLQEKTSSPNKKIMSHIVEKPIETNITGANRLKKKKKNASCLWESSNHSFDVPLNSGSMDSQKEFPGGAQVSENNKTNNLNVSCNMGRKLKLPTNQFWKKFIGKTLNSNNNEFSNKGLIKKEKTDLLNKNNENNKNGSDIEWLKRELFALKEKVIDLEESDQKLKIKTDKLEKKYKKLKKEKENLKKMNDYLIEQNKGILSDIKDFSSKSGNKNFDTVLKSLNEFEKKLKNSIICSNKLIISQD